MADALDRTQNVFDGVAMKLQFLGLTLALLLLSGRSLSQEDAVRVILSDVSGNTLLHRCTSDEGGDLNFCVGYIEGIRDATVLCDLNGKQRTDIPAEVTSEQMKDVVVKYLRDHPEERHKQGALLVIYALRLAFPTAR